MPAQIKPSSRLYESCKWPVGIFAAALIIRIVNLTFLSANDPSFYYPQVDSLWHHSWALDILNNSFWGSEVFFRAPLYPYFLAFIYAISGGSIFFAKVVQAVGGAIICVLIYQLGKSAFTETTARISGLIAVFYGPLIFYESELLLEWLAILFALTMLLVLLRSRESVSLQSVAFAGLLGGLSAITRPNILIVFPLIAFWIIATNARVAPLRRRLLSAAVFALGVIACVLPVTIRNYVVAGDFVLISSQGGVNLHLANNSEADGLTMVMPEINLNLSIPWSEFVDTTTAYAESGVGRTLKPSEVSEFWGDRAWSYILEHPVDFLSLTGKRIVYLFSGFENPDQADLYRFSENSPILAVTVFDRFITFPFGIIAPLALIGIALGWRERRRISLLYIFLLGYIPTIVLFLVTSRHRLAVVVILIIFAGYTLERAWQMWQRNKRVALAILAINFVALAALLNHNWFDLGYDNPAQFHYQRGLVFEKQGDLNSAIAEYREATKYQQLPEALNNLGYALSKSGDMNGAYQTLHQAIQSRPNYTDAITNLGLLFLNRNELDSAEFYLNFARRSDPNLPQVYLNLGDLHQRRGNAAEAESILQIGIATAPRFVPLYNSLANLYLKQGRDSEARPLLEQAIAIDPAYAAGHVNLANILLNAQDYVSAKRHYQAAIGINPGLKPAHMNLALLYLRINQPDSARSCFEAVVKIDPNDRQARDALQKLPR
ncbi:MAG: tetratricopeptide repeat protein [bacterium]|nr:tetratricopeptide repeat protein [bacterium]